MKVISGLLKLVLAVICIQCSSNNVQFKVVKKPWTVGLGSHRVVMNVHKTSDIAEVTVNWRRHDRNIEDRRLIIINNEGDTVKNILRYKINEESAHLAFGPVKKGTYYLYYLPYYPQSSDGSYLKGYLKKEPVPATQWTQNAKKISVKNIADVQSIEARTDFENGFPMEIIATKKEKNNFLQSTPDIKYFVFPESRKNPIRMTDNIPQKWLKQDRKSFEGKAFNNEYYVFQLGVWAIRQNLEDVHIQFGDLTSGNNTIKSSQLTCFNTGGIGFDGKAFTKNVNVPKGNVQAFWIGVDVKKGTKEGTYTGVVSVKPKNAKSYTVKIKLSVSSKIIKNRGDDDGWRLARLRWLNTPIAMGHQVVKPFIPVKAVDNNTYSILGRKIKFNKLGLPSSITAWGTDILSKPIELQIKSGKKTIAWNGLKTQRSHMYKDMVVSKIQGDAATLKLVATSSLESDGFVHYVYNIIAKKNTTLDNVKLVIPFKSSVAQYMMGMGRPGSKTPAHHSAKWRGPHDSFWMGNTKGGIHCELRGSSYTGPLLNEYHPRFPHSWDNDGKGGFTIDKEGQTTYSSAYSGKHIINKGDTLSFDFAFIITPVKKINTKKEFKNRYHHSGDANPKKINMKTYGIKVVNYHHSRKELKYINYPFIRTEGLKKATQNLHTQDINMCIYYTIRELTNRLPELWTLKSLGDEIISNGRGGGYVWLREHLVSNYAPRWYHSLGKEGADAAMRIKGKTSRWYNFYLCGLNWLFQNVGIDGIYLDDVAFDREVVKRMKRIMNNAGKDGILNLHSNTGFSRGPVTQYTGFFPYLDKLWFGESFIYNQMPPANWLVEVSGIPFGLMGDMLYRGGNQWIGMLYGMSTRYGWESEGIICHPEYVWKFWDDYDIGSSKMVGYWEPNSLIKTNNKNIKVTYYDKKDQLIIAVASWNKEATTFKLIADWKKLGVNINKAILKAPPIEKYQGSKTFKINQNIPIEPMKGWLLVISK